jgi:hypothetical protein
MTPAAVLHSKAFIIGAIKILLRPGTKPNGKATRNRLESSSHGATGGRPPLVRLPSSANRVKTKGEVKSSRANHDDAAGNSLTYRKPVVHTKSLNN